MKFLRNLEREERVFLLFFDFEVWSTVRVGVVERESWIGYSSVR